MEQINKEMELTTEELIALINTNKEDFIITVQFEKEDSINEGTESK